MTDTLTPTPSTLTDQAIAKLQKLAAGNGLAPESIKLLGSEEKTYLVKGTTRLSPFTSPEAQRTIGPARAVKNAQIASSFTELKSRVEQATKEFQQDKKWLPDALELLKTQPGGGWGITDAKILLESHTKYFVGSEACPTCRGQRATACPSCQAQGAVVCNVCHGSRGEICPVCSGFGFVNGQQDQPCQNCAPYGLLSHNGMRAVPCRRCNASGQMICPTCNGRRGVPCESCKATGAVSETIKLVCGFEPHFVMVGEGLPSGLRRGVQRLGIDKLAPHHADISIAAPIVEETLKDSSVPKVLAYPDKTIDDQTAAQSEEKNIPAEQHYEAQIPYADMRMDFNGVKALVPAFGKRCLLLDVPAFLDTAIEPQREALRRTAQGHNEFDKALAVRVISDALNLTLSNKLDLKELRRRYPYGLSAKTATELIQEMRSALNRTTLAIRTLAAALCAVASIAMFAVYFLLPPHVLWRGLFSPRLWLIADIFPLILALGLSQFLLAQSTRFILHRRFSDMPIATLQKTGKTGYTMMGVILATFIAAIALLAR